MTRVMVMGAAGMLGHKVVQRLAPRFDVVGVTRRPDDALASIAKAAGARLSHGLEASDASVVRRVVQELRPAVIVNCVGIIKQRPGVDDPEADRVNASFPHALGRIAAEAQARVVHLSTDCVFSGAKGLYSEADVPDPVDAYGRGKLAGELSGHGQITLRTSIVGRELHGFRSLLEWFLHHPRGSVVKGFRNAIFSGLTNVALADEIARLIGAHASLEGMYHLSAQPISKFDLLQLFNAAFDRGLTIVPDDEFHCDRSLLSDRYRQATGFQPESWTAMVGQLATDPTPYAALQAVGANA